MDTTQPPQSGQARENISLRVSAAQKSLIDRAAARLGKSRTEFMLDSAREAAENALLDQRLFVVEESVYDAFMAALDAPPEPPEALRRLLAPRPAWSE